MKLHPTSVHKTIPLVLLTGIFLAASPTLAASAKTKAPLTVPSELKNFERAKSKWIEVNISKVRDQVFQMPEDERMDQMRDWIVLASITYMELKENSVRQMTFEASPIRYDFLSSLNRHSIGPGRAVVLPSTHQDFLAFVPSDSKLRTAIIGRLADEIRMKIGSKPKNAYVMEYEIDNVSSNARVRYVGNLGREQLFGKEMGYHETTIKSREDLKNFITKIDDLTTVNIASGKLVVGGRRFNDNRTLGITLEDIAALYQADQKLKEQFAAKVHSKGVLDRYNQFILTEIIPELRDRFPAETVRMEFDELVEEAKQYYPYERFEREFIEQSLALFGDNTGFSLDPKEDPEKMGKQIAMITAGDWDSLLEKYVHHRADVLGKLKAAPEIEKLRPLFIFEHSLSSLLELSPHRRAKREMRDLKAGETDLLSLIGLSDSMTPIPQPDSASTDLNSPKPVDVDAHARTVVKAAEKEWEDLSKEVLNDYIEDLSKRQLADLTSGIRDQKEALTQIATALQSKNWEPYRTYLRRSRLEDIALSLKQGSLGYLVKDSQEMLVAQGADISIDGAYGASTANAVQRYQERKNLKPSGNIDFLTWKALLDDSPLKLEAYEHVGEFLDWLQEKNSYQCARYIGELQGTEVGMTLFYTDAMMKLWAMDYKGSSPQYVVKGFTPVIRSELAPIYWDNVWKHPATRGWLGPLSEGYEFHNGDGSLVFSPLATRLFNASSDPLQPGKEVTANASSEQFANWWNSHYRDVADYEPQFHRLNEIMKWSIALTWLKGIQFNQLSFLRSEPVNHALSYDHWYAATDTLRTRVPLPFLQSKTPGQSTECLQLLESDHVPGMGKGYWSISGGVSLGSKLELSKRLGMGGKRKSLLPSLRMAGIDLKTAQIKGANTKVAFHDGRSLVVNLSQGTVQVSKTSRDQLRGLKTEFQQSELLRKIESGPTSTTIHEEVSGVSLGSLKLSRDNSGVALEIAEGDAIRSQRIVDDWLSNFPRREEILVTHPDVEDAFRLPNRNGVLIKLRGSEKWLAIHRPDAELTQTITDQFRIGKEVDSVPQIRHGALLQTKEVEQLSNNFPWQQFRATDFGGPRPPTIGGLGGLSPSSVPGPNGPRHLLAIFDENGPPKTDVPMFAMYHGGRDYQVAIAEDSIYVKNSKQSVVANLDDTIPLRKSLSDRDLRLLTEHQHNIEGSDILLFHSFDGKPVALSRTFGVLNNEVPKSIASLVSQQPTGVDGIILRGSSGAAPRLRPDGLIEISANASEADIATIRELFVVGAKDPDILASIRQLKNISEKDISTLVGLSIEMRQSYVELRGLSPAFSNQGFVDLRFTDTHAQELIMTGTGNIEARALPSSVVRAKLEAMDAWTEYQKGLLDDAELLRKTRAYVNYIETVASRMDTRIILTKEDHGAPNLTTLLALHSKRIGDRHIRRDQTSISASLDNSLQVVALAEKSMVSVASTVHLTSPQLPEFERIRNIASDIENLHAPISSQLTWDALQQMLLDKALTQHHLIVRARPDGLVLNDQLIKWEELEEFLDTIPSKRFIHLVTNGGSELVELFASSGKFRRVLLSRYQLGDRESFEEALDNIKQLLASSEVEASIFGWQEYEDLLKSAPLATSLLERYAYRLDGKVLVDTVQLLSKPTEKISDDVKAKLQKHVVKGGFSDIDVVLDRIGRYKIEESVLPASSLRRRIQSIIELKVERMPEDERTSNLST